MGARSARGSSALRIPAARNPSALCAFPPAGSKRGDGAQSPQPHKLWGRAAPINPTHALTAEVPSALSRSKRGRTLKGRPTTTVIRCGTASVPHILCPTLFVPFHPPPPQVTHLSHTGHVGGGIGQHIVHAWNNGVRLSARLSPIARPSPIAGPSPIARPNPLKNQTSSSALTSMPEGEDNRVQAALSQQTPDAWGGQQGGSCQLRRGRCGAQRGG